MQNSNVPNVKPWVGLGARAQTVDTLVVADVFLPKLSNELETNGFEF
jgi:hypothetical protein